MQRTQTIRELKVVTTFFFTYRLYLRALKVVTTSFLVATNQFISITVSRFYCKNTGYQRTKGSDNLFFYLQALQYTFLRELKVVTTCFVVATNQFFITYQNTGYQRTKGNDNLFFTYRLYIRELKVVRTCFLVQIYFYL